VTHNKIQDSCTGPDFALGEVYGLRQWTVQRSSVYRTAYSAPNGTQAFSRYLHLTGHFSNTWELEHNVATCKAAKTSSYRLHVSPEVPPMEFMEAVSHGSGQPQLYLIDIMLKWAEKLLRRDGIEPRDVHRLEINGGRRGGTIIATADWVHNALLPTYTDYGTYEHDGLGRFVNVDSSSDYIEDRFYDENFLMKSADFTPRPLLRDIVEYVVSYTANANCKSVAQPSCTCGYYAYNNTDSLLSNSYTSDTSVFGLIRGYGKVTIVPKGFRAEKADIVALTHPHAFRRYSVGRDKPIHEWIETSRSKELADILIDTTHDYNVKILKTPQELFQFARVHLDEL